MKFVNHTSLILFMSLAAGAVGCGATVSDELMQARSTYQQAAQGQAMQLEPEQVMEAKQALTVAERAHEDDANSAKEKHYAYIALRKAEQAIAQANATAADNQKKTSDESYVQLFDERCTQAEDALAALNTSLRIVRFELDAQQDDGSVSATQLREKEQELQSQIDELEKEQKRRSQAEQRLKEALSDLKHMASVQDQLENLAITLNSAALFEFGKSELMEASKDRLRAVVDYLNEINSDKQITIHGYTDSVGTDAANLELSRERAESVKRFLVANGIDSNRIDTIGHGENNPLAGNDTAAGQAMNRRVEIDIAQ